MNFAAKTFPVAFSEQRCTVPNLPLENENKNVIHLIYPINMKFLWLLINYLSAE